MKLTSVTFEVDPSMEIREGERERGECCSYELFQILSDFLIYQVLN